MFGAGPPSPAIEPFVGQGSLLISAHWRKTEPLVCAAIEAQEHTLQLLEALGSILPAGSTDPIASALLTDLFCMASSLREVLATGKPALVAQRIQGSCCGQQ